MIDLAYSLKVITGPTVWVADADAVRHWGRKDATGDEDDLIMNLVKSSTKVMETLCNRIFCTQTLELWLDEWPADGVIQLPSGPWQSILSAKYYEPVAGVLTTITSTDYLFNEVNGILTTAPDIDWPIVQDRRWAIQIRYKAGYGDLATDPPAICKQAVIEGVLDRMENRHGRFEIPAGTREELMALWPGTV